MENQKQKNGLGTAGLVLGIVGIVLSAVAVGGIIGIIGIILSIIAAVQKGKKKGAAIAGIILNLLAIIIVSVIIAAGVSLLGSGNDSKNDTQIENTDSSDQLEENMERINESDKEVWESEEVQESVDNFKESVGAEEEPEEPEVSEMSEEEFKASCQSFDYKTIARNPDEYIGQNFVVEVQVFTSANGGFGTGIDKYYKAYTNDEYDEWMGEMIYVIESQDENSESYVKVLDDDIIRVYGTFNGMVETENSLTGETGEDVSLNMIYCELISE